MGKRERRGRGEDLGYNMQLGTDPRSEGGNLGIEGFKLGSEYLFDVIHFGVDGGMHVSLIVGSL
jgi:hypothetical protein